MHSQPKLVLIYWPRRDERLSWPRVAVLLATKVTDWLIMFSNLAVLWVTRVFRRESVSTDVFALSRWHFLSIRTLKMRLILSGFTYLLMGSPTPACRWWRTQWPRWTQTETLSLTPSRLTARTGDQLTMFDAVIFFLYKSFEHNSNNDDDDDQSVNGLFRFVAGVLDGCTVKRKLLNKYRIYTDWDPEG